MTTRPRLARLVILATPFLAACAGTPAEDASPHATREQALASTRSISQHENRHYDAVRVQVGQAFGQVVITAEVRDENVRKVPGMAAHDGFENVVALAPPIAGARSWVKLNLHYVGSHDGADTYRWVTNALAPQVLRREGVAMLLSSNAAELWLQNGGDNYRLAGDVPGDDTLAGELGSMITVGRSGVSFGMGNSLFSVQQTLAIRYRDTAKIFDGASEVFVLVMGRRHTVEKSGIVSNVSAVFEKIPLTKSGDSYEATYSVALRGAYGLSEERIDEVEIAFGGSNDLWDANKGSNYSIGDIVSAL